jgi:hypothetical protein
VPHDLQVHDAICSVRACLARLILRSVDNAFGNAPISLYKVQTASTRQQRGKKSHLGRCPERCHHGLGCHEVFHL